MATWQLSLVKKQTKGFSIIEVITAVAILGIGIWAIVALFPKGQNIIRRSGLRQMATQLAHEAISDYLAEPAKMPFAIVPFDPVQLPPTLPDEPTFDPQNPPPFLLEPAYLRYVRRTYNFVWGEPLDDGLPQGDPNKRVGLVSVDLNGDGQPEEWQAILQFAPVMRLLRVYREISYQRAVTDRNGDNQLDSRDLKDFEYAFNEVPANRQVILPVLSPPNDNWRIDWDGDSIPDRILRVSYDVTDLLTGAVRHYERELYLVRVSQGWFDLSARVTVNERVKIQEIIEEFPIPNNFDPSGVLTFSSPMPAPPGVNPDQLGALRADYVIDGVDGDGDGLMGEDPPNTVDDDGDGKIDEDIPGHWPTETGNTFPPDPSVQQRMNLPTGVGVFQTTFGGLSPTAIQAIWLDVGAWGTPLTVSPTSDFQSGLLVLLDPNNQPLPPNARVKIAYLTGDDWFVQIIKPPSDFQLMPQQLSQEALNALSWLPFENLRYFEVSGSTLQFVVLKNNGQTLDKEPNKLLAGLNVLVRYRNAAGTQFEEVQSINANGQVALSQTPARIEGVFGASLLTRISGRTLWQQAPPQRKGDYIELLTIVPPSRLGQP